jgi:hypothetical protein
MGENVPNLVTLQQIWRIFAFSAIVSFVQPFENY